MLTSAGFGTWKLPFLSSLKIYILKSLIICAHNLVQTYVIDALILIILTYFNLKLSFEKRLSLSQE